MKLSRFSSLFLLAVSGAVLTVSGCVPGAVDLGGPNETDSGSSETGPGGPDSGTGPDTGTDSGAPIEAGVSTSCVATPIASTPLASEVTPSSTESEFRALIVGKWVQYEGACLETNVVGVEFLADGTAYNLARLSDGTLQRLAHSGTWSITEYDSGAPFGFFNQGVYDGARLFFDNGQKMQALFNPWYTNLQRVP